MNQVIKKYYCPNCIVREMKTQLVTYNEHEFGEVATCECGYRKELWHAKQFTISGGGNNETKTDEKTS